MSLPFQTVDIEAEARSYKLRQRGAEDGGHNQPKSGSEEAARAEHEVIAAVADERERCLLHLCSHLRADRDALAQLQTAMDIAVMRQGAGETRTEFQAIRARYGDALKRLARTAEAATAEYDEFRARNRITRMAIHPSNRGFSLSLLAFLACMESVFNAVFFASGSDAGLLGGVVLAFAFSAVNISVGLFNGWFPLRWMRHRGILLKALGLVASVALGCATLFLVAFIAHYRDASGASAADPLAVAYIALTTSPLRLASIESWFLLALGLLCAGVAVAKGYGLSDPYPGYGPADRRMTSAQQALEVRRHHLMDEATEARDAFTDEMRTTIESLRGASTQRKQILNARARNIAEFVAHEAHLANAAQQLLSIYRTANEEARFTPCPAHFGRAFAFRDAGLDRPDIRALREDQGLEVDAEGLIAELDRLRASVLEDYESLMHQNWAGTRA